ncbi:MAG: tyrosine-type recombinase/integrase [Anaerolineaceae bacterium]|nr:tyrosine-type recombinase/integrase [Anaerolineaceae bacterium]
MNKYRKATTIPQRYDQALRRAHHHHLPANHPKPCPTSSWPQENILILEQYYKWLLACGFSQEVAKQIYIPAAGHVLGLSLKLHHQLDLDTDIERAMDYIKAKKLSPSWTEICRHAFNKFRRFLSHQRGIVVSKATPYISKPQTDGMPDWLVRELNNYQLVKQRNWRAARIENSIRNFGGPYLRLWHFLSERHTIKTLKDIKRQYLFDYIEYRLDKGYAVSSINTDIRYFNTFMKFLHEQGHEVPKALKRIPCLKQPESLPKFLSDKHIKLLRDDFENRVFQATTFIQQRDAFLDRAAFHLLWQGGLRIGEVEELQCEDLDLEARKLFVREGKGLKDRTVFLTDSVVRAMRSYLAIRGPGPTDHVFLYRNQPLCKDLVGSRLKATGERVGVKVHPHRLRHTAATQLVNAGCPIISIQKFLGHKQLNTTMIYARVHDRTVAEDYYTAMAQIEKNLDLVGSPDEYIKMPISVGERSQLKALTDQLEKGNHSLDAIRDIAGKMNQILDGYDTVDQDENQMATTIVGVPSFANADSW